MRKHYAQLAQLVEQRTENPCVSGSIPELGIVKYYGILAQLVEHLTFNQVVRGSNPRCLIPAIFKIKEYEIVCYNMEDYQLIKEYLIPADGSKGRA